MEINIQTNDVDKVWNTSVQETIIIFRDALVALVPIMDRAYISYGEHEQYDDYDAIAETLYEQIVISSMKWAFHNSQEIEMPAYGFEFDPEKHNAYVEAYLNSEIDQEKRYIFRYLSSRSNFFDTVTCYPVGKTQSLFSEEIVYIDFKECRFQLRFKTENGFDSKSALTVLL